MLIDESRGKLNSQTSIFKVEIYMINNFKVNLALSMVLKANLSSSFFISTIIMD